MKKIPFAILLLMGCGGSEVKISDDVTSVLVGDPLATSVKLDGKSSTVDGLTQVANGEDLTVSGVLRREQVPASGVGMAKLVCVLENQTRPDGSPRQLIMDSTTDVKFSSKNGGWNFVASFGEIEEDVRPGKYVVQVWASGKKLLAESVVMVVPKVTDEVQ